MTTSVVLFSLFSFPSPGNKPLVVGGMRRDSNPTEKCSVLDLEENCWKELPDILTPRYAASVHLNGDKIYVLGMLKLNASYTTKTPLIIIKNI